MTIRERGELAVRLNAATLKLGAYLAEDTGALLRWKALFADDIDVCQRAHKNITTGTAISLVNLRAAVQIAERLAGLAEEVDGTEGATS